MANHVPRPTKASEGDWVMAAACSSRAFSEVLPQLLAQGIKVRAEGIQTVAQPLDICSRAQATDGDAPPRGKLLAIGRRLHEVRPRSWLKHDGCPSSLPCIAEASHVSLDRDCGQLLVRPAWEAELGECIGPHAHPTARSQTPGGREHGKVLYERREVVLPQDHCRARPLTSGSGLTWASEDDLAVSEVGVEGEEAVRVETDYFGRVGAPGGPASCDGL
mmetsp:Transcript_73835/g.167325  ORF Transcript_73835/g.167325 Transcript_73835/m.167325 type:complete len:219 (+) Transcript_73835:20-676(+)